MARVGRPRVNDRRVLNGILYVLVTGCRWMNMPSKYGSHKTAWDSLSVGVLKVCGSVYLMP